MRISADTFDVFSHRIWVIIYYIYVSSCLVMNMKKVTEFLGNLIKVIFGTQVSK